MGTQEESKITGLIKENLVLAKCHIENHIEMIKAYPIEKETAMLLQSRFLAWEAIQKALEFIIEPKEKK